MGFTAQSTCDLARSMLNDDDGVRHTTAWFMRHLVPALDDLRRVRPDLFVGTSWLRDGVPLINVTTVIPMPPAYQERIAHWLAGLAIAREDDQVDEEGKAQLYMQLAGRT